MTDDSGIGNKGMTRTAVMVMVMAVGASWSREVGVDVSSSSAVIGRRRSQAVAMLANSGVPSHDVHMHNDDNNAMMMTMMMTIGLSSLALHGWGWVGCKTG